MQAVVLKNAQGMHGNIMFLFELNQKVVGCFGMELDARNMGFITQGLAKLYLFPAVDLLIDMNRNGVYCELSILDIFQ